MRPLHLTICGLHSYREPVSVDFEELGRFGLFGIFGPIGSGKSTLLDAITLALYGLVDRVATRSRKGLVNQHCDQLEVRFRFSVPAADGSDEAYEVHRRYRDDDGVAQRVGSRIVHLAADGRRDVLADKEREVLEVVTELVGLTAEDFMRAVVLPQGRFMQFLHLKGSERRQMLQRIFHLGAYGEGIRRGIKVRRDALRETLSEHRGELAGLGDASTSAVRTAKRAATEAATVRTEAERAHAGATEAHGEAQRVRERQVRLAEARTELAQHRSQADDVARRETRVAEWERVRPVLGPGRRWIAAGADAAQATAEAERANTRAERLRAAFEHAEVQLTEARARLKGREGPLRQQLSGLDEALRWAAERQGLTARAQQLSSDHEAVARRVADTRQRLEQAEQSQGEAVAERKTLRQAWAKCKVPAEERERIQRAYRSVETLQHAQTLVTEARAEHENQEARATAARRDVEAARGVAYDARRGLGAAVEALEAAAADPALLDESTLVAHSELAARAERAVALRQERQASAQSAETGLHSADDTLARAERALTTADKARRRARQVLDGADDALAEALDRREADARATAAAVLAQTLTDADPCPVCGSDDHPAPASPPAVPSPGAAVDAHRRGRARALTRWEQALTAHASAERAVELARAAATDARARFDQATTEARAHEAVLEQLMAEAGIARVAPGAVTDGLAELRQADRVARARLEACREAARRAELAAERADAPVAAAEARLAAVEASLTQAAEALAARQAAEGDGWDRLERDSGTLTLFDIPNAVTHLERLDRQAEQVVRDLDQIDARLADLTRTRDDQRAALARATKDEAQLQERLDAARSQLSSLETRIRERTGGRDPAAAAAEVRTELEALQRASAEAEAAAGTARSQHTAAASAQASAAATRDAAARATVRAREALDEVVTEVSELAGLEEAVLSERLLALLDAGIDEASVATERAFVEGWRRHEAELASRVAVLTEELGDERVDDERWAALEQALAAATAALDAARDAAITAHRHHAELTTRAARHAELVAATQALDAQLTRLEALATVLRGNRFVEFIANDYLRELAEDATRHLAQLTRGRYGLQLDDDGSFLVRDDDAGGNVRPVHTLSGGETFLTSLALALALSSQVQARSARPLEFFFLDEGFGTLDGESLDRVMTAIENLRGDRRLIGLISHVPAVKERVPRFLDVHKPGTRGDGSTVELRDS